ncbi:MAG: glycoside hydrolase family 68 protein [Clostridiaceae bacterium]
MASEWTREQTKNIKITVDNEAPRINFPLRQTAKDLWIWDTWPLLDEDGSVSIINGWKIIFALSSPRSVLPGKRHDIARIVYFYSRDGFNWIEGGKLFSEGDSPGSREWAGSALNSNGHVYIFYTAAGRKDETNLTYEQRIVMTCSEINTNLKGVCFTNWSPHKVILEPDGVLYQSREQSMKPGNIPYTFRDPWFFRDKKDGNSYLLFEANTPGTAEERKCEPPEARPFSGAVGLASSENDEFTEWKFLPHILDADCVNQELERPHFVFKDDMYYLFINTHVSKFAPGVTGPDGLYGFVSNSLTGNYVPLNGGGLVTANPISDAFQAYSWVVLQNGTIISFVNFFNLGRLTEADIGNKPESFELSHFGGTLAPTLQINIDKDHTELINRGLEDGLVIAGSYTQWKRKHAL